MAVGFSGEGNRNFTVFPPSRGRRFRFLATSVLCVAPPKLTGQKWKTVQKRCRNGHFFRRGWRAPCPVSGVCTKTGPKLVRYRGAVSLRRMFPGESGPGATVSWLRTALSAALAPAVAEMHQAQTNRRCGNGAEMGWFGQRKREAIAQWELWLALGQEAFDRHKQHPPHCRLSLRYSNRPCRCPTPSGFGAVGRSAESSCPEPRRGIKKIAVLADGV